MTNPIREAEHELAAKFAGLLKDPHAAAAAYVRWLLARDWRPPTGPVPDWRTRPHVDPAVAQRGAEAARQAMARQDPA